LGKGVDLSLYPFPLIYPAVYPYPYPYPLLSPDAISKIAALRVYQDSILKWEAANAIAGLVSPSAETVIKLLNAANG
jgi:hypothetical protein